MATNELHLTKLLSVLEKLAEISPAESLNLYKIGSVKNLQKGEFFIRAGEVPKKFGFVNSGLFRYVYVDEDGRQFTKAFMPENSIISSYSAMLHASSSYFSIEALENSVVIEFSYSKWLKLKESNSSCWNKFLLALLEKGYIKKETRERELLLLDAETRYQNFLDEYPSLESRVKQHMIASYLGITPESLSRIRKISLS